MSRLNVKDSEVFTVWTCKECPEAIFVHPDFFQDNGTPMCCDQDMIYDRTFVETETTAIFYKNVEGDNLLMGDEVYWNDPDKGTCSGHGTFVRHLNDEVAVIRKDDVEMEVFVKELS